MRFSDEERAALLTVKGVGPKVVERIEQLGLSDFRALAERDPRGMCEAVAALLGSACWGNSPHARAVMAGTIGVSARPRLGARAAFGHPERALPARGRAQRTNLP